MLSVFYGDNRAQALAAARQFLGANYETIDGENLTLADLPSIFLGNSLFDTERHILIKDLLSSKDKTLIENLPKYIDTSHKIALLEEKLDKRSAIYKALAKVATIKEFKAPAQIDRNLAFNVYDLALRDGQKAVQMATELTKTSAAQEVIGAWTWKAAQNYKLRPYAKERRILYALAQLDLQIKNSSTDPWLLLQAFLLTLSSL